MHIRILIADDYAIIRDGLRSLLEAQAGLSVIDAVSDGRQAVDVVRQLKPDIVVMDISMPVLNGIEATREIRKISPGTQVIILSMYNSREYIYRAFRAGARGYLLKETAGAEIANAVFEVYSGKHYLSQRVTDLMVDNFVMLGQQAEFDPLDQLSPREREVLQLVVEGKTSAEIGQMLSISSKTVDTYRSRIMGKLNIADLPNLVKFAIQHGLISLD